MKKGVYIIVLLVICVFASCDKKEEKKPEVLPVEKVKDTVPTQVVKEEVKVEKKEPVITFTVQIGAFKEYGQSFAKLPNVVKYNKDEYSKYALGSFGTVREAVNFMYSIEEDHPDAFVQALKDGNPIPIKEALK